MASEWVGVAGTAIGAGIGGVVTVVSLTIKGKQDREARADAAVREEDGRKDDRTWQVKLHNLDQRRLLYADLLRLARNLEASIDGLRFVKYLEDVDNDNANEARANADATERAYNNVLASTEVTAVDRQVLQLASRVSDSARTAIMASFEEPFDSSNEQRQRDAATIAQQASEIQTLLPQLIDACRRDIGVE